MLLARLMGRGGISAATPENPSFNLSSPDAWDALGAVPSDTGQSISAEVALTWSAWWRGVTLIALYVAKTPLYVYKNVARQNGEGKEVAEDHPAYRLLRWQANEMQTAFQLQLALAGHAVNRGNGYAYIVRRGPEPVELLLLDPDETTPVTMGGRLWYTTKVRDETRKIPADDVLHLKGFGFDGLQGYPAFQMAKQAIGLGLAGNKHKAVRYKNGARPGVVLQSANKIGDKARQELRKDWERMHSGLDNAHRTAVLDNGLTANTLTFSAEEMQEVEQAGLTIRDAANFLGIPSSKLGDVAGIKYASKEQDDQSFLSDGLDFWFCSLEDESRSKLLLESEKESGEYSVCFDRTGFARGDRQAQAAYNRVALGGRGWKTVNEVRKEEGLPPDDNPDSDTILTPLNMGQGGTDNRPDPGSETEEEETETPPPVLPPPDNTGALRAAAASTLADTTRRMVRRIGTQAVRHAKEPAKYMTWLASFEAEHRAVVEAAFEPVGATLAALGVGSHDQLADLFFTEMRRGYNRVADTATPKELPAAVEAMAATHEGFPAAFVRLFLGDHP